MLPAPVLEARDRERVAPHGDGHRAARAAVLDRQHQDDGAVLAHDVVEGRGLLLGDRLQLLRVHQRIPPVASCPGLAIRGPGYRRTAFWISGMAETGGRGAGAGGGCSFAAARSSATISRHPVSLFASHLRPGFLQTVFMKWMRGLVASAWWSMVSPFTEARRNP